MSATQEDNKIKRAPFPKVNAKQATKTSTNHWANIGLTFVVQVALTMMNVGPHQSHGVASTFVDISLMSYCELGLGNYQHLNTTLASV